MAHSSNISISSTSSMPAIFVGHGSPLNAISDNAFTRAWESLGALFAPRAIVGISAHYHTRGLRINSTPTPRQIYDMSGFPRALYELAYQPKGDPALAERLSKILSPFGAQLEDSWGIDHGLWSVLCKMYKNADIPLVCLSVDLSASLESQLAIGRVLSVLRQEGVMILASGNIVHNLSLLEWGREDFGYPWALEFDRYIIKRTLERDAQGLLEFEKIDGARVCVPTLDHFLPFLIAFGASTPEDSINVFNRFYTCGVISMTSFVFA